MVGYNPDFDYLYDPQAKEDRTPVCSCCHRPTSQCSSYTEICEFIFCEYCMNTAVTIQNLVFT